MLIDEIVVGKHPPVTTLLKGVLTTGLCSLDTQLYTRDVGQVLENNASIGRNENLGYHTSLQCLWQYLIMRAENQRFLHTILDFLSRNEGGISFTIAELTKTARPAKKAIYQRGEVMSR